MFKNNIVFVVGAGGSREVGLPMGTELKNKIAQELNFEFEDGHNQSSGSYRIVRALEEFARKRDETDINLYLNAGRAISRYQNWKIFFPILRSSPSTMIAVSNIICLMRLQTTRSSIWKLLRKLSAGLGLSIPTAVSGDFPGNMEKPKALNLDRISIHRK